MGTKRKSLELVCSCGNKVKFPANDSIILEANKESNISINTTWNDTVIIECSCGNKTRLPSVLKIK